MRIPGNLLTSKESTKFTERKETGMLKEVITYNVTTYKADYGFFVDVIDEMEEETGENMWSVWLYRDEIGFKYYMFGLPQKDVPTIPGLLGIIERTLMDHYKYYDDKLCPHDDVNRGYLDKMAPMEQIE